MAGMDRKFLLGPLLALRRLVPVRRAFVSTKRARRFLKSEVNVFEHLAIGGEDILHRALRAISGPAFILQEGDPMLQIGSPDQEHREFFAGH